MPGLSGLSNHSCERRRFDDDVIGTSLLCLCTLDIVILYACRCGEPSICGGSRISNGCHRMVAISPRCVYVKVFEKIRRDLARRLHALSPQEQGEGARCGK